MNKLVFWSVLAISVFAHSFARAETFWLSNEGALITPSDLIDWKVGDEANYNISSLLGKGTMKKGVTRDEGTGLWVKQELVLGATHDTTEILINKADAKILKMIHNGKEEPVPDQKIEIISQDYGQVTVPAGTFKALHVVAKTPKVNKIEIWVNPNETCMEGMLKQVANMGFISLTLELTSFVKK